MQMKSCAVDGITAGSMELGLRRNWKWSTGHGLSGRIIEDWCTETRVEEQYHVIQILGLRVQNWDLVKLEVMCSTGASGWAYGIWDIKLNAHEGHNNRYEEVVMWKGMGWCVIIYASFNKQV